MAVSAILNFGQFSTFDLDDIEGRVTPLFKGFQDGKSISRIIFCIRSQNQDQIRRQRSHLTPNQEYIISIDRLHVVRCLGDHDFVVLCMLELLAYTSMLASAGWKGQAI